MVSSVEWRDVFHIIPSRYPVVGIFDDVANPQDLTAVVELAAATNPRILEDAGELTLVRDEDRISGPNTTAIMAAFTHTKPSRFSDGSYGVYYAGRDELTAIAETAFHRGVFLRNSRLSNERLDMRVYTSDIEGQYDELRHLPETDPLYDRDPTHYGTPQAYARTLYRANVLDGIVYKSVRRPGGECAASFRPRRITRVMISHHLEYRFRDYAFQGAFAISGPR